ncbi:MAG: hypothetical protein WAN65_21030 [Candidatus Sulfotelmatobacter sp.]
MSKYVVQASWDGTPHLSPEAQNELASAYPPHERDARMRGVPQLGSGAIFPVPESEIVIDPFELPAHFKYSYGLDVGWNRTAAVWSAHDTETDVVYLYSEYYRAQAEPPIHATSIRSRGEWIPGVIDPAARGRTQDDGLQMIKLYEALGLRIIAADNSVETGIYEMWVRLSSGRMKVFSYLQNWRAEYRMYRRDEKGRVVKSNDHLMDATRYDVMSGLAVAQFKPPSDWPFKKRESTALGGGRYDPFADLGGRDNAAPAYRPFGGRG